MYMYICEGPCTLLHITTLKTTSGFSKDFGIVLLVSEFFKLLQNLVCYIHVVQGINC